MANRRSLSQFSLDGLLINGLQVRVLPGSPLSRKDLAHFLASRFFPTVGTFCGDSYLKSRSPVYRQGWLKRSARKSLIERVARGTSEVPEQADERMSRAWNRILRHVTLFSNIRQINTFVLSEVSATSWLIRFIARFLHSGTQRISGKRTASSERKEKGGYRWVEGTRAGTGDSCGVPLARRELQQELRGVSRRVVLRLA